MRELEKGRATKRQSNTRDQQSIFSALFRYLPHVDQVVCKEEDTMRQKPLGLDNMALPFSILVGAFLLRSSNFCVAHVCCQMNSCKNIQLFLFSASLWWFWNSF